MNPLMTCTHKYGNRERAGPTGRREWMILVDRCMGCGHLTAIKTVTWTQYYWVVRFNLREIQDAFPY